MSSTRMPRFQRQKIKNKKNAQDATQIKGKPEVSRKEAGILPSGHRLGKTKPYSAKILMVRVKKCRQ
jgi:hypothetical protein